MALPLQALVGLSATPQRGSKCREKIVRSTIRATTVYAAIRIFSLAGILLICCIVPVAAATSSGGIICRDSVPEAARDELAKRLRAITGWPTLGFDREGSLRVGQAPPLTGSVTARKLLSKALSGNAIIILEDASNRSDVAFSRIVPGRWIAPVAEQLPAYVVLVDFADYAHLIGDRQAREAFNVGWGVLHEIDHAVNDSLDAIAAGQAGECEEHVNQMRRECHLPVRREYYYTFFSQSAESDFKTKFVKLAFEQNETSAARHLRYWLVWDAQLVGGLPEPKRIAGLR